MKHKLHDNVELYYEIHGNATTQKTLVFLNGLSQSTIAWGGYLSTFSDYRIILLDLVFQGQSGAALKYRTFNEHAGDVISLLDHLGINKVTLVGISYGGAVAQHIMVNYPSRIERAVLMSTFAHKTPHFNAIGNSWVIAVRAGGYGLMLDIMLPVVLGEDYFKNPLIPIDFLKQSRLSANLTIDNLLSLMKATEERADYRSTLQQVKIPTLVIQGEKDVLTTPEIGLEIAKNVPDAKFEVVKGAGHTLNLEAIPQTSALIRNFLNGG